VSFIDKLWKHIITELILTDIMHGGSESIHKTPVFRIVPEQQFAPPPGRLPHPLPPHVPQSSAQQISLLNTLCGQLPGVDVGVFEGLCEGLFVGIREGDVVGGFDVG